LNGIAYRALGLQMLGSIARIVYLVVRSGRVFANLGSMLGSAGKIVMPHTTVGLAGVDGGVAWLRSLGFASGAG
jgi:hypothetical protein